MNSVRSSASRQKASQAYLKVSNNGRQVNDRLQFRRLFADLLLLSVIWRRLGWLLLRRLLLHLLLVDLLDWLTLLLVVKVHLLLLHHLGRNR